MSNANTSPALVESANGKTHPRAWKAAQNAAKICAVLTGLYLVMRCVQIMVAPRRRAISLEREGLLRALEIRSR